MKIKITSAIGIWVGRHRTKLADIVDTDKATADSLIERGLAEAVKAPAKKAKSK
jgi:hypothetical protein